MRKKREKRREKDKEKGIKEEKERMQQQPAFGRLLLLCLSVLAVCFVRVVAKVFCAFCTVELSFDFVVEFVVCFVQAVYVAGSRCSLFGE